jgi:N-acetylglucosaminyl-diphospho-decaprenol L-rhamnosyltransferase
VPAVKTGSTLARVPTDAALDVVIVSFRCRALLRECLRSLEEHGPSVPTRIYVVDNASNDGTVEMVAREFREVTVVANEKNLGFSAANNIALAQSTGDFVLILNPDTRMRAGVVDRLLEVASSRPETGILGCRLEQEDGTFDHAAKRSFPTPLSALGHFSGLGRGRRAPRWLAQYRAPDVEGGPVDAVNGAFMLIRRHALNDIGLFDEGYWMYMEDLDLCYRAHRAGWITWYEPSVSVMHVKAGTSGRLRRPHLNYAFHYGMFRFYRKFYAAERPLVLNAIVYAGIAAKLVVSIIRTEARRLAARTRASDPDVGSSA